MMRMRPLLQYAQQGFTLIELMIVVAIIGILSAIALAAYQDYLAKTQLTEALTLSETPKIALAEYYFNIGGWPATNGDAGLASQSSITGKYVSAVNAGGGYIDAQFKNTGVSQQLQGKLLRLSPIDNQGSISWVCRLDVPAKLLPRACQTL